MEINVLPYLIPPTLSVLEVCQLLEITSGTYRNWERKGVAPKRIVPPGSRAKRVLSEDLERWLVNRQNDRMRTGRWHLRHPLTPKLQLLVADR